MVDEIEGHEFEKMKENIQRQIKKEQFLSVLIF
jgi:hypothetical protein